MKTSESIVKISAALLKAQKNIGAAVKGSANPFFKSRYADLGAVMEACKEHLNDVGITVLQPVLSDETGDFVETVLLHESGEFISSRMRLLPSKNMQELGSATSYARRYGLQSLVFIPQVDDDGNHSTFGRAAPEAKPLPEKKAETPKPAPVESVAPQTLPVMDKPVEAPKRSSFKKPAASKVDPAIIQPKELEKILQKAVTSDDGWE